MFDCRLDCHMEVHAKPCCLFIMSQYQCTKHTEWVSHLLSTNLGFVMSPFPVPASGRRAVHTGVRRSCAVGGRRPDRGAVFDVVMGVQHVMCCGTREAAIPNKLWQWAPRQHTVSKASSTKRSGGPSSHKHLLRPFLW